MRTAILSVLLFLCLIIGVRAERVFFPLVADRSLLRDVQWATVTSVVDGDTIWVDLNGDGQRDTKVRYIGISTPEISFGVECYGPEAKARNRELVESRRVQLEKDISETDIYDRLLRYVYLTDGTFVNGVLVSEGYAQATVYRPDRRYEDYFALLEEGARIAGRGGWGACGW